MFIVDGRVMRADLRRLRESVCRQVSAGEPLKACSVRLSSHFAGRPASARLTVRPVARGRDGYAAVEFLSLNPAGTYWRSWARLRAALAVVVVLLIEMPGMAK